MRKGASSWVLGRVFLGTSLVYLGKRPGRSAGSGCFLPVRGKRLSRSDLARCMGVKPPVTTTIFDSLCFGHGLATRREGGGPRALAEEYRPP